MAKLSLQELEIKSFVTAESTSVQGGGYVHSGRCTGPTNYDICTSGNPDLCTMKC